MADIYTTSGEDSNAVVVPPPQLQGIFIPGIDNPLAVDGFGLTVPWGGGSTTRRYGDYGISAEVSQQSTQLHDLSTAFFPTGGGTTYNLEGLIGPQGIPGQDGTTLIIHEYVGLNSSYLTALPHNLDLINVLGTATDKLIYTDALTAYGGSTNWTERQPAGATDKYWTSVASDSDGSNLIACVGSGAPGRIYTSADYGVTWAERQPMGDVDENWTGVASDADGSHLVACALAGRLYTSNNYGASWTERRPAGDANKGWSSVASDSDGSNLIACVLNGRLYTSSDYGVNWTERQPDDADDNYWTSVASDDDGSVLIAGKGNTTVAALYISVNSGVSWSEEIPAAATTSWYGTASDADGSHLVAGADKGRLAVSVDSGGSWTLKGASAGDYWKGVSTNSDGSYMIACSALSSGHLYESFDSGVTWAETKPAGATTKNWRTVATAKEGSSTIVAVYGGRLYTGTISVGYSEATWAESDLTSAGRAILDDVDAAAQAVTLGLEIGVDTQAWDTQLDDIAALAITNGNFIVGDGSNWIAESGNTARTSLGIGEADTPTLGGLTTAGTIDASSGEVLVEDNDVSIPAGKDDGYIGVAVIGGTARIYFNVGGVAYYVDGTTSAIPIEAGMIMGPWLFWGTYAAP